MNMEPVPPGTLFARLLTDIMIPPQLAAAIRAQGYDVAENFFASVRHGEARP
jgi:hypothetical protein